MSDDFFVHNAGDTGSYLFPGGDDFDKIVGVWTTGADVVFDLRNDTLDSIEQLEIGSLTHGGAGPATGGYATMQLYAYQVPEWFVGNYYDRPSHDIFEITMGADAVLDLSTTGIAYFARGDFIRVLGNGASETITGSWTTDVIEGRKGKDSIDGGDGWDIADYTEKSRRVDITLKAGEWVDAFVNGTKEDKLRSIEAIFGGKAGDRLTGDKGGNLLAGGGGKDTLDGAGGSDWVDYTDKTKRVEVTLNGSNAVIVKIGGVDEDTIRNFENVYGGGAGDVLTGDSHANQFNAGAGRDSVDGAAGIDTADYSEKVQAVRAVLKGTIWADVYVDGVKEDRIRNIEKLIGGYGDDTLTSGSGFDTLQGGPGKDRLNGGDGFDTADYSDRPFAISVDLKGDSVATVKVDGVAEDKVSDIENVVGSFGDDQITGDNQANRLEGGAGRDTLRGGRGVDTLMGGDGDDVLRVGAGVQGKGLIDGGSGHDTLVIDDQSGSYVADLRALTMVSIDAVEFGDPGTSGSATVWLLARQFHHPAGDDAATISGSGGDDVLRISIDGAPIDGGDLTFENFSGRVFFVGGAQHDSATGTSLADSMSGGRKSDTFYYSLGYDTVDGGSGGGDQIQFHGALDSVSVTLNGSADSIYRIGGVDAGVIRNIEDVAGGQGDDSITGDAGDNWLEGFGGRDTIDGGDGIDTLGFGSPFGLNVDLAAGTYSTAGDPFAGSSTISNIENVAGTGRISGDDHANVLDASGGGFGGSTLSGRDGNDRLIGGKYGNAHDVLDGGAGRDTLTGGDGDDTFVFSALTDSRAGENRDIITDFDRGKSFTGDVGNDEIDVSAIFAGALTYRGTNAFDGLGQLRVRASGSDVIVEVNAEGNLAADFSIRLSGVKIGDMSAGDFVL